MKLHIITFSFLLAIMSCTNTSDHNDCICMASQEITNIWPTPIFTNIDSAIICANDCQRPIIVWFDWWGSSDSRTKDLVSQKRIATLISSEFIFCKLMVDSKIPLPLSQQYSTQQKGKNIKVQTEGQRNAALQFQLFKKQSQPYFAILSPDGETFIHDFQYCKTERKLNENLKTGLKIFTQNRLE